jgi:uncharacterized protein YndB with AHSA1/START domain
MTDIADPRVIEIDQFYPHPPQRVWQALTAPEFMARWLMEPSGFAPVVGTRFSFRGQPMPSVDFSGATLPGHHGRRLGSHHRPTRSGAV